MTKPEEQKNLPVPHINFNSKEHLLILEGRCIPADPTWYFNALTQLASGYILLQGRLRCQIKLEYFNSASTRAMLQFLKMLEEQNQQGASISVEWFYETDDEDSVDFARDLIDLLELPIELIALKNL